MCSGRSPGDFRSNPHKRLDGGPEAANEPPNYEECANDDLNADRFSKRSRILFPRDGSSLKPQGAQRYSKKFGQHRNTDNEQTPQRCHLCDLPMGCRGHGTLRLLITRIEIGYSPALSHDGREARDLQWYERYM